MKYKYKRIDTSTLKGLKKAENLCLNHNWRLISCNPITSTWILEKPIIDTELLRANKLI